MDYFRHERAMVDEGAVVGKDTRVWANAHVLKGAVVGESCNLGEGVFIEGGATLGNNVTVKNGVQVWEGITLEDNVFCGPNCTFTNDMYPRSGVHPEEGSSYPLTTVHHNASLGGNCTILPGVTIGAYALVGAGAVVTRDVAPHSLVVGNPARHVRFLNEDNLAAKEDPAAAKK